MFKKGYKDAVKDFDVDHRLHPLLDDTENLMTSVDYIIVDNHLLQLHKKITENEVKDENDQSYTPRKLEYMLELIVVRFHEDKYENFGGLEHDESGEDLEAKQGNEIMRQTLVTYKSTSKHEIMSENKIDVQSKLYLQN